MGTETVTGTLTVMGTGTERERGRSGSGNGGGSERRSAGRGRGRGWGPVDEHRTGTGTGTGTEAGTVAEMGTGTTITRTRRGLGRAEGRRKSARSRKIIVDAVRETVETRVESEKNVEKRVGSVAANPDNLGSNKEAGGAQGAQGPSKFCTGRESVSPLSRLIRGFRNKYH